MAAVADHKGIRARELDVEVQMEQAGEGPESRTCFRSVIHLGPGLTARERRLLFNAARTCEVHKMLRQPIEFAETLSGP